MDDFDDDNDGIIDIEDDDDDGDGIKDREVSDYITSKSDIFSSILCFQDDDWFIHDEM